MKKIILSVVALAASVNLMAAPTTTVNISMTSASSTATLLLVEDADHNATYENGYDAYAPVGAAMYAVLGTDQLSKVWTDNLDEVKIAFSTTEEVTLTFSGVTGRELKLWDGTQEVTVANDGKMTFTPTAAMYVTINDPAATPAEPNICHRYGKLEVYASDGQNVEILTQDGKTSITTVAITADYQEIVLDDVLAGQAAEYYMVKWNGKELIIKK